MQATIPAARHCVAVVLGREGGGRMQLNHLYLMVRDLGRSRAFYATYFGFDGPSEWQAETFVIRNEAGFSLALTPNAQPPAWPRDLHFGFLLDDYRVVLALHERMAEAGVPIVESMFEGGFAVFKCLDPDGYVVEVEAGHPGAPE